MVIAHNIHCIYQNSLLNMHERFKANLVEAKLENYAILCDLRRNNTGDRISHIRMIQGNQLYIYHVEEEILEMYI